MDPNANLREQESILTARLVKVRVGLKAGRENAGRLTELRAALAAWIHGGGFEPEWAACRLAAKYWRHLRASLAARKAS